MILLGYVVGVMVLQNCGVTLGAFLAYEGDVGTLWGHFAVARGGIPYNTLVILE